MNMQHRPYIVGEPIQTIKMPPPAAAQQKSKIELLLDAEALMRDVSTLEELSYLLVNDWRPIISAKQIYILEANSAGVFRVAFTSDVTSVDARAPFCTKLCELVQASLREKPNNQWQTINLTPLLVENSDFPFPHAIAAPLAHKAQLLTRQVVALAAVPFTDSDRLIAARLGTTAAHAYWAMSNKGKHAFRITNKLKLTAITALCLCLAGFIPVPLSILAPTEIVAQNPFIAAAPLSGVIESIDVEPNSPITAGTILFRLNDVELKSTLDIAQKSVAIAEARLRRAQQGAGASTELRREVGISLSELAMSIAERDGALARMERTVVRAPYDGVVMFNRKEDWIGKPVSTGERILEIANPKLIEASIEVGVADSIVLDSTQSITLFLDSNPLKPITAAFKSAGYQAASTRDQQLAFPVRATITTDQPNLRIGQRGTAQMRAQKVSLAYFLFRRPLAALRQKIGL
jgi:HlyD family secretion protein